MPIPLLRMHIYLTLFPMVQPPILQLWGRPLHPQWHAAALALGHVVRALDHFDDTERDIESTRLTLIVFALAL